MKSFALLILALLCVASCSTYQDSLSGEQPPQLDRPNILWLTFEDTSAYELSVYGNDAISMPNLAELANDGIVFSRANSTGPQCSPARSSLISGNYASRYGADHHRAPVDVAPHRLFFPALMRKAGYFTTNNSKRDYNAIQSDSDVAAIWDEYDNKATYNSKKRKANQPFFSVFNAGNTHMSRLTSYHIEGRRNFTQSAGVAPDATPSYLPDLPEIKSDYQFHLEGVTDIDKWIGIFIDDLKAKGLHDDTIVFVYSDHGGSSPRGKGFLYNSTSLHVPFVVHVPKKYQHLIKESKTTLKDKMVSFIDFGPTVLSLAGVKTPEEMAGQAFLGAFANHNRELNFSFRTNQELHYDPMRSVTDGRYSYIRNYLPRKPLQLRNDFQWGMPSNIALDDFAHSNAGAATKNQYYQAKQNEYLFDLSSDTFELVDLSRSENPTHQRQLEKLRNAVQGHITEIQDLGFVPVAFKKGKAYEDWVADDFPFDQLYSLVEAVATASTDNLQTFIDALNSKHPVIRFWAAQGMAELTSSNQLTSAPSALLKVSKESVAAVAVVANEALAYLGSAQAVERIVSSKDKEHRRSALETIAYLKPEVLMPVVPFFEANDHLLENRVVLAALGLRTSESIASDIQRKKGNQVNQNRRPIKPLP